MTTLQKPGYYPPVCGDLARINNVFGHLWASLKMDLSDRTILSAILRDPSIENHRTIFIQQHQEEPSSYALATQFNTVADRFFKRDETEPAISPLEVRYAPILPLLLPIEEKWHQYVEVVYEDQVTDLIRYEERTFTHQERIPLPPDRHWDPTQPITPEQQRYKFKEVTEKHVVPVYRTLHIPQLVFCDGFDKIYHSYTLSGLEEKRYSQLQAVADQLNKIFGNSTLGSHLPALFEFDYMTKKVKPSGQLGETMKKFLNRT